MSDVKWDKFKVREKISEKDIERNLQKLLKDEPLDLPLSFLDGRLKHRLRKIRTDEDREKTREYLKRPEVKARKEIWAKQYYIKNKKKIKAYQKKYYRAKKKKQL